MKQERISVAVLAALLTTVAFWLFKFLSVSTKAAAIVPISLQGGLLSSTGPSLPALAVSAISMLLVMAVPFVFLSLALAAVAVYGLIAPTDRTTGMAAVAVGSLVGVALVGLSYETIIVAAGAAASAYFVHGSVVDAYRKETKWKNYKGVSHAVGRGLIVLNVFIAAASLAMVAANIDDYEALASAEIQKGSQSVFSEDLTDEQVVALMAPSVRERYDALSDEQKQQFLTDYRALLKETTAEQPRLTDSLERLITTYLYATPLVVFGTLESLRSLLLVHIAGLAAVPVLRRRERFGLKIDG
ncbi:MAG: hypothetical protein HYS81_04285 [Candidatus Aenigmatarchaeota archaeon]|nr:MAG: hypothetical protein HYS81_04285 [Candidatus Aenigmarchaeota archaeon]